MRELNPAVPEPLAELIHQLLAKNPDRPASAEEVAARARAIAAGVVGPAAPPFAPLRTASMIAKAARSRVSSTL